MPTETVRESDGIKWIDRGPTTDDHLSFTGHEIGLTPFVKMLARPESIYVNVGAHVGTWALRVAKFGLAEQVYAIEANPATYEILKRNIDLNYEFTSGKVKAMQEPVWDSDMAVVHFVDAKGMESGGSTRVQTKGDGVGYYTRTLNTIFPSWDGIKDTSDRIGFIQMDVEGAEARILSGASKILDYDRPNLLIELHEHHPGTDPDLREKVYSELERHNYNYFSVHVAGNEEHLICRPAEEVDDFMPDIIQGNL